ncbi:hypothetical protein DM02DRAFT_678529 [Periconia macrospinosa]|uniref:Rhodopsin domain-containing protein n=1 Tax=Periconia macrospinosa TaxID=97972 RepID=A0A2V1CYK4_9PLEO|nr:hypothetical protein DM02DRAFT_678529 [Periconia macrospinosa]
MANPMANAVQGDLSDEDSAPNAQCPLESMAGPTVILYPNSQEPTLRSFVTMVQGPTAAVLITTDWVFLGIALLIIFARLHLRLKIHHQRLIAGDYLIIMAWFASMSNGSFDIVFMHLGILKPEMDVALSLVEDLNVLRRVLRYFWATNFPFYATIYLCKASVLTFYLDLFPKHNHLYRILLYAVIGYSTVAFIVSLSITLFLCFPVQRQWSIGADMCLPGAAHINFQVGWAFHFSSGILIFLLPFLILHKLQVKPLVKRGVQCMFGLGIINIAICLTRFLTIELNEADGIPLTLVKTLLMSLLLELGLWYLLDGNIGLIIACLPSLRPYLRRIHTGTYGSRSVMYKRTSTSGGKMSLHVTAPGKFDRIEDMPEHRHIHTHTQR